MKIYVITIRYKTLFDNEWIFENKIIETTNIKEAINKIYKMYDKNIKIIIENIYSESKEI